MNGPNAPLGIVVGVDGSSASHAAAVWAAHEAMMRNVALTLVHASPAITSGAVQFVSAAARAQLEKQRETAARQVITDAISAVSSGTTGRGPDVTGEVIHGHPVPTLVDLSKEAQMMVIGPRGLNAFGRVLLGSVSTALVQQAHCPVAVIRDDDRGSAQPNTLPVVVGIDGSPVSELATEVAFDEASRRGVDLIAVHAWGDTTPFPLPDDLWPELRTAAEEILAERLAGFQERYPDVTIHRLVVADHPTHCLLDQSESAQLVVVGSHGRGGFAGMLLGSVSSAIVHAALTPVIVVRRH